MSKTNVRSFPSLVPATRSQPAEDNLFEAEAGWVFQQIRLKVANLREAEAAGLAEAGAADEFLLDVQAIVAQYIH